MKQIKITIATLALFLSVGAVQSVLAQTPPIPCSPTVLNPKCDNCVCNSGLPEGCTETSRTMLIYSTNPNCLATVYYRLRKCEYPAVCYPNKCQIIIDSVVVDPWESDCVQCEVTTTTDMKAFLAQIERQILMHGAYYGGCGYLPASPTSSYNYVMGKPACWKKTTSLYHYSLTDSVYISKYEPCDLNICCISSYCMTINEYGTFNIVKVGPEACPEEYDCALISGCAPSMDVCKP